MKKNGKAGRNDFILLVACLGIGLILFCYLHFSSKTGDQVQVRVDGTVVAVYSLDESVSVSVTGYQDGTNQLEIHDGKAWVQEASCPDDLCVHMGKISQVGQSVVCLPNHLVVEIVSTEDEKNADQIDIIAR